MHTPTSLLGDLDRKAAPQARRIVVSGRVQGVGFRPFVYRLAHRLGLCGWVRNENGSVQILAQGAPSALAEFEQALIEEAPPLARTFISSIASVEPQAHTTFAILPSRADSPARIHVPPDYFACDDCLRELHDPADRRYLYPFINCTQCGPRYTLIRKLPYDRPNTTMAGFPLCPACRAEYEQPADRRFHAEPVACPACGPTLDFVPVTGVHVRENAAALAHAVAALRAGKIVAVKGIGGYHLMCDARNDVAVARLRARKPRPHKPLAVMFPMQGTDGLDAVRLAAELTPEHERWLRDPVRPIVLAEKKKAARLSPHIAPGLKEVGAMLPYSPLHHLLVEDFGGPLVATSANVSGEPVLTDNDEVHARLAHVAEAFLHHDRPIQRPADDPVLRVIAGHARPLRHGRGSAPLELDLPVTLARPLLAVGGQMKNSVALAWDDRVVVSPHIGDLGAPRSLAVFEQVIADLQALYGVRAQTIVCDAHPAYVSSRWARRTGLPVVPVFHHHGHAAALAGEHPEVKNWLVFTWDGVGYGMDGTLWGGEALLGVPGRWRHAASLRPFRLPGGEKAAREPWRSAVALCWESGIEWKQCPENAALAYHAWRRRLNSPPTTAVGRLFDAAAALTGLNHRSSYEGQGPMMLEAACDGRGEAIALPLARNALRIWETDWAPLLAFLMDEHRSVGERASGFHTSLAQALLAQARTLRAEHGDITVGLSGGVFQNRVLTEQALALLQQDGFDVRLSRQIPCNDGGLCFGQIVEAQAQRT